MEKLPPQGGQGELAGSDPTTHLIVRITQELQGSQTDAEMPAPHDASKQLEVVPGPPPPDVMKINLPDDIDVMLDVYLDPAEMTGQDTKKFVIDGLSEFLVRLNAGARVQKRYGAKQVVDSLPGVNVVPQAIVPHHGEAYVVTKIVEGRTLEEMLSDNPSETLLRAVDQNWKSLTDALIEAKLEVKDWTPDIDGCHQYMVGTLHGDTSPRLWMVDLPSEAVNVYEPTAYEVEVLQIANGLSEIEEMVGRKLPATRWSLYQALQHFEDQDSCGDGWEQAVLRVLNNPGVLISPVDQHELLNRLRTR